MDEKKYLAGQLDRWRRRIRLARLLDYGTLGMTAGGCAAIVCEAAALVYPFYEAHLAAGLCFAAGLLTGVLYALCKKVGRMQAAGRLDSFGLQERMVTACWQLENEDLLSRLQREDAVRHYKKMYDKIRIPLRPHKRRLLALLLAVLVTVGAALIPSPARERAELRQEIKEQAGEEKETLENLLEALTEIEQNALTEEQKERLRELTKALALSGEELAKADSQESLQAALNRLAYKYGQTAQTLESMAALDNLQTAGLADAQALARAAAEASGRQTAQAGPASGNKDGSGEGSGNKDGSQDGTGGSDGREGAGEGAGGADGNGSGDEDGSGNGNGAGDGDGSGNGNGSGDGDGSGNGNGSGDGDGSGNGNGSGSGNGNGSGDGDGSGNGNGSGNGGGAGRGTGSSDLLHDYVSIPGKTGSDAALTGEKIGGENSDYYRAQNGLAWEGEHVDYNAVIGEYTDNAYEGIANDRYPSGMEPVIRDYFESLNQ